jgi:hypothetical protein
VERSLHEIPPLIVEGMLRYDQLQQARAVVPEDVLLRSLADAPIPHPDEYDGALVDGLWAAVRRGAAAGDCESAVTADLYRIWRLLAHWVVDGVVAVEEPGERGA